MEANHANEPRYLVVHICLDAATAETELPALFGGDVESTAASALGTNATRSVTERGIPKILLFGGDIPDGDVDKITGLVKEKSPTTISVKVSKLDVLKAGGIGPNPDVIAKVYRKKIAKEL